jgi:hypothetical protein
MQALHKDGKDGDHHKIGGMLVEFTVEPWRWRPLWLQRPYYSQFDMIIYVSMTFLSRITILFMLDMWWMFCHDRIAFLKKR